MSNDELAAILRENYAARARHELPDEMHWADTELLRRGFILNNLTGELEPLGLENENG